MWLIRASLNGKGTEPCFLCCLDLFLDKHASLRNCQVKDLEAGALSEALDPAQALPRVLRVVKSERSRIGVQDDRVPGDGWASGSHVWGPCCRGSRDR